MPSRIRWRHEPVEGRIARADRRSSHLSDLRDHFDPEAQERGGMSKETGGSAFPHVAYDETIGGDTIRVYAECGMTLRDYFAAKALVMFETRWAEGSFDPACAAHWAYQTADAMLAARAKDGA
jgi:hypothetical protein